MSRFVDTATDYVLDDRGAIPDTNMTFSVLHSVQTGCGAYQAS
jgi:hypothetical protein